MDFSVKLRFSKDSRLETFFCYALHQKVEHMLLVTSFGSSETQPEVCEYNTQLDKLIIPFYNLFAAECIVGWLTSEKSAIYILKFFLVKTNSKEDVIVQPLIHDNH